MTNFFADLESDLGPVVQDDAPARAGYLADALKFAQSGNISKWDAAKARKSADRPVIDCPKCRGTGKFITYTGRVSGNCFKCDGAGKTIGLKQDDASVKARQQAAVRRDAKKAEAVVAAQAWGDAHVDVLAWIDRNGSFEFAASLREAHARFGSLTEGQVGAVRRCIAREDARKAERAAQAATAAPVQGLDLSSVPAGRYAVPNGDTRLKVLIKKPTNGKWQGFIFVSDAAVYGEQTKYGMQAPNKAYRGQIVDALTAIAADPKAAAVAYGHLTSTCSCCGRPLEDEASVARGIGPICAAKHGW